MVCLYSFSIVCTIDSTQVLTQILKLISWWTLAKAFLRGIFAEYCLTSALIHIQLVRRQQLSRRLQVVKQSIYQLSVGPRQRLLKNRNVYVTRLFIIYIFLFDYFCTHLMNQKANDIYRLKLCLVNLNKKTQLAFFFLYPRDFLKMFVKLFKSIYK